MLRGPVPSVSTHSAALCETAFADCRPKIVFVKYNSDGSRPASSSRRRNLIFAIPGHRAYRCRTSRNRCASSADSESSATVLPGDISSTTGSTIATWIWDRERRSVSSRPRSVYGIASAAAKRYRLRNVCQITGFGWT